MVAPRAWVRVASSAQSRWWAYLFLNPPHAETARWKRRVPRARFPIYAQATVISCMSGALVHSRVFAPEALRRPSGVKTIFRFVTGPLESVTKSLEQRTGREATKSDSKEATV